MNQTQQALFDKLYSSFPKKKSVGDGEKAFATLNPNQLLVDEMIEAAENQRKAYIAEHGPQNGPGKWKFFKAIGPWIRQKSWLDEVAKVYEKRDSEKICECGEPAGYQNQRGWQCIDCYTKHSDDWRPAILRQEWKNIGSPRTQSECMEVMCKLNPAMARLIGARK
jgi:hypothetical protein